MNRSHLRIIGALFWIGMTAWIAVAALRPGGSNRSETRWGRYFFGGSQTIVAIDPSRSLRANDPVFFPQADGQWTQIGHVTDRSSENLDKVHVLWYWPKIEPNACRLVRYQNDGRLSSVIATMLPAQKRKLIQHRLAMTFNQHGDELAAAFAPLVESTLVQSLPIVERSLAASANRHRQEIDRLAERWNQEIVNDRLVPMARKEILPILREHGQPTAETIGRELWDSASLWRFGWRWAYDQTPLPRRNLTQQEWDRFVQAQAVPIIESHMDEIVESVQQIVREVAANDAVRDELRQVAAEVAADPEVRQLAQTMLREALVENSELRQTWSRLWSSKQAESAFELASDRFEFVVRQIGDELFGSEETGINPDFARVLRNQILGKDRRWIVAEPGNELIDSNEPTEIVQATETMPYPIVHVAGPQ